MEAYGVYNYRTNRPIDLNGADSNDGQADRSVAAYLSNQASFLRINEDFSLEVVITSLAVEQEQMLRSELINALSKGTCYAGTGNLMTLPEKTLCYFCVVRETPPEANPKSTPNQGGEDNGTEGAAVDTLNNSYCASDYVICFTKKGGPGLHGDTQLEGYRAELEGFRTELDAYCTQLVRSGLLDQVEDPSRQEMPSPGEVKRGRAELAAWYDHSVGYLPRCVKFLGKELHYVIQAALLGQKVNIADGDPGFEQDMAKLMSLLSLAQLLHRPAQLLRDDLAPSLQQFLRPPAPVTISMKHDRPEPYVAFWDPAELPGSPFCQAWAKAMLAVDDNAIALKNIVLNHGRTVIEEVNTMKKLMGQAESNHYALYNANNYLSECSTPSRALLQNVVDTMEPSGTEAIDVLSVLIDFQIRL